LQNYILSLLESNKDLNINDIIIMVTDIDAYLPFIKATFSNLHSNKYIPFSISHNSFYKQNPIIITFLDLLSLFDKTLSFQQILNLLDNPQLSNHFDINESELNLLYNLINKSSIPVEIYNTKITMLSIFDINTQIQTNWCISFKNMLLSDDKNIPKKTISKKLNKLIFNLSKLICYINYWNNMFKKSYPLQFWIPLARKIINDFFNINKKDELTISILDNHWRNFLSDGIAVHFKNKVHITFLRYGLYKILSQEYTCSLFINEKLNFCSITHMNVAFPFKVVCLLGLNYDNYPRTSNKFQWDLINNTPRKGDYNNYYKDRYSFLEILMSAQNTLYISYIDGSNQYNTKYTSSILITELLEYIGYSFYIAGDENITIEQSAERIKQHLIKLHSYTPFDSTNFQINSVMHSFAHEWLYTAQKTGTKQNDFIQPLNFVKVNNLNIKQLLCFWKHPIQYWFNKRLGINFNFKKNKCLNNQLSMNDMNHYNIKHNLLNTLIKGNIDHVQKLYLHYMTNYDLPSGVLGELLWQDYLDDMQKIVKRVRYKLKNTENWQINLQCDNITLTGFLTNIQEDGLLRWHSDKLNIYHGLLLWLEHLIYCSLGGSGNSLMVGSSNKYWYFDNIKKNQAMYLLNKYIKGYYIGMSYPIILLNKSGSAWLNSCYDKNTKKLIFDTDTQSKAINRLLLSWIGGYKSHGECKDPYLQRWSNSLDRKKIQQIIDAAQIWYLPVLQAHKNIFNK
ncbi:MAG: exonuclease V subunit gamma, partial [Pantoea sp. Brub]|nr:exonuclease V subunit gamma [Pantoea sp. Brub]